MKKIVLAFLFFSAISFCVFSFGQSSNLEQCVGVDVAMERLACYDSITASIQPTYCSVAEHSWSTECGGNLAPGYCAASQNSSRPECGGGGFYQLQQLLQQPAYCSDARESWRDECGGDGLYQAPQSVEKPYYCSYSQELWRDECGGDGNYQSFLTQPQKITIVRF